MTTREILINANKAKASLSVLSTEKKNEALYKMASAIEAAEQTILAANKEDVEAARGTVSDVMIDRLSLSSARISDMANGVREVAALPDPVGRIINEHSLPNGLTVKKTAVSMGVVAIIYESRPNVTSDAAALALKSGNVDAMRGGLREIGLPENYINMIEDTTRQSSNELMTAVGLVDLLIPRGGAGLIRACVENAKVPCIQTGTGICHVYVDEAADIEMALNIIENAKTSRPSVCNAEEVLLVNDKIAQEFLPKLKTRLVSAREQKGEKPVELRLDKKAAEIISGTPATDGDFDTEFLDYILAVKIVSNVGEAIEHIALHSTHHSDAIITNDSSAASRFAGEVDSAAVYVNASTRFTDGGQFGLGCEMGISTQKLHARGPMGLEELTSYKYVVIGEGQIR